MGKLHFALCLICRTNKGSWMAYFAVLMLKSITHAVRVRDTNKDTAKKKKYHKGMIYMDVYFIIIN